MRPATWKTRCTPRIARRTERAVEHVAVGELDVEAVELVERRALAHERPHASPRSTSRRVTCDPTRPVAPVTRVVIAVISTVSGCRDAGRRGGHRHHPLPAAGDRRRARGRRGQPLRQRRRAPGARGGHRRPRRVLRRACARPTSLPTTSQPSIGDFLAVYEPLVRDGRDIVSIHISGGISGTVEAARQAAAELAELGLRGSRSSTRSSPAARSAWSCSPPSAPRARGADVEAVAARAREAARRHALWFAVDTLEYLQRGGRIGAAQAWLGGALKIKPILTFDGEIVPIERVRTAGRGLRPDGPLPAVAPRRRRRRLGHPAHPGARRLRAPGRQRARDLRQRAALRLGDRARSSAPTPARASSASAASRWALLEA